jgi:hypothetical protein
MSEQVINECVIESLNRHVKQLSVYAAIATES